MNNLINTLRNAATALGLSTQENSVTPSILANIYQQIATLFDRLYKRLRGQDAESSAYTDPQLHHGSFATQEALNQRLDQMKGAVTPDDPTNQAAQRYTGRNILQLSGGNIEVWQYVQNFVGQTFTQIAWGRVLPNEADNGATLTLQHTGVCNAIWRTCNAGIWTPWKKLFATADTEQYAGEIDINEIDTLTDPLNLHTYTLTTLFAGKTKINVGRLTIFSDNNFHVITQIIESHYDNPNDVNSHIHTQPFRHYRSYGITQSPDNGTTPVRTWTPWKPCTNLDTQELEEIKQLKTDIQTVDETIKKITWGPEHHLNGFVTQGTYRIIGERTLQTDGMPILNAAPGHTIDSKLIVMDSSIQGTGDSQDKCITQLLMLSNRTGGDGNLYIRTGHAASIEELAQAETHQGQNNQWNPWSKLQANTEVGIVTDLATLSQDTLQPITANGLKTFIDNGIYSGIYTDGATYFETFVMVTINNYAITGALNSLKGMNIPRSISQFKYALSHDGIATFKTRVKVGNGEFTDWQSL